MIILKLDWYTNTNRENIMEYLNPINLKLTKFANIDANAPIKKFLKSI